MFVPPDLTKLTNLKFVEGTSFGRFVSNRNSRWPIFGRERCYAVMQKNEKGGTIETV